jgi:hypothetical protein
VNLKLIQSIRLIHALAESDFPIYMPAKEVWRFSALQNQFSLSFTSDPKPAAPLPEIVIRHDRPLTSIGQISRPLIFPHAILSWCRNAWPPEPTRDAAISFCGLVTSSRRAVLRQWLKNQSSDDSDIVSSLETSLLDRLKRFLLRSRLQRYEQTYDLPLGRVLLYSSKRGRVFPIKAWDEEYFRVLLRSRFVLCPNGDYVWSYRFFEAILCGAIPIVEESCPAYAGFHFNTMADSGLVWSREIAEQNYELCVCRLTIGREELNAEIASLLKLL